MPDPTRILVVGTGNKHKAQEIAPILLASGLNLELKAAGAYGPFEPVEDGITLEENAKIKADAAVAISGEWAIADDTGLFVEAIGGRPGIYAARYAGEGCSFADNIRKLLGELNGVPTEKRNATFSCVIALSRPKVAETLYFRGDCRGTILAQPRGIGGFGYDPVFVIEGLDKTFAEISAEEKNRVSHRSIAVRKCRDYLQSLLR